MSCSGEGPPKITAGRVTETAGRGCGSSGIVVGKVILVEHDVAAARACARTHATASSRFATGATRRGPRPPRRAAPPVGPAHHDDVVRDESRAAAERARSRGTGSRPSSTIPGVTTTRRRAASAVTRAARATTPRSPGSTLNVLSITMHARGAATATSWRCSATRQRRRAGRDSSPRHVDAEGDGDARHARLAGCAGGSMRRARRRRASIASGRRSPRTCTSTGRVDLAGLGLGGSAITRLPGAASRSASAAEPVGVHVEHRGRAPSRISDFARTIASSERIRSRCTGPMAVIDADVGLHPLAQRRDLAAAVRAHLGDEDLGAGRQLLVDRSCRAPGRC